jgi:hypothetical protein
MTELIVGLLIGLIIGCLVGLKVERIAQKKYIHKSRGAIIPEDAIHLTFLSENSNYGDWLNKQ